MTAANALARADTARRATKDAIILSIVDDIAVAVATELAQFPRRPARRKRS